MSGVERLGDVGARKFDDNRLATLGSIVLVLETERLVLTKGVLLLENHGDDRLGQRAGLEEEGKEGTVLDRLLDKGRLGPLHLQRNHC